MDSLKKMETAIEEAGLSLIEQPLCRRLKMCASGLREESDDLNGYEE